MIAVVHGPRGCGKSTALRDWLAWREWMPPRGYRTFVGQGPDGSAALRLASWDGRVDIPVAHREREHSPGRRVAFDPACAPALHAFLDHAFSVPAHGYCIQPPAVFRAESAKPLPPWRLDVPCFRNSVSDCISGDSSIPLVIDELGVLETLPGALDLAAPDRLVAAIRAARNAILVIQERAFPFWRRCLGFP